MSDQKPIGDRYNEPIPQFKSETKRIEHAEKDFPTLSITDMARQRAPVVWAYIKFHLDGIDAVESKINLIDKWIANIKLFKVKWSGKGGSFMSGEIIERLNDLREWLKAESKTAPLENTIRMLPQVFTVDNWQKYVDFLTTCVPRLLKKENDTYTFIGNKKIHTGCVAQYFKYLKNKGIVDQSLNRDELAETLSTNIQNYQVSGATIDNQSKSYSETFQDQLEKEV